MKISHPYLLFLGDAADPLAAKTANGIARWRPEWCLGQLRLPGCAADVGLPDLDLDTAYGAGARSLIVGVANRGGTIDDSWRPVLLAALQRGMDIASGLHVRLALDSEFAEYADKHGCTIFDVRYSEVKLSVGSSRRRRGKRLLTVGTDVSCGKMFTALAMERELHQRGVPADFRATGQTGILIAGDGIAVDAVISDFIAGAAEWLTPDADEDHWDLIEGQGSLFHLSYAGVTLGLIHGSQPDVLVLCHDPRRESMRGLPDLALPPLRECIELNERCARRANPDCRVIGLSLNTSTYNNNDARRLLTSIEDELGLPVVDAYREGAQRLVDALG
ncbi:MAG: N-acetyltransferase DgcN [Candidatus Latescibacterota bacterium]|nr:N-acetyltransferase DgcN [Candidatus Latescibacterota bacterium]